MSKAIVNLAFILVSGEELTVSRNTDTMNNAKTSILRTLVAQCHMISSLKESILNKKEATDLMDEETFIKDIAEEFRERLPFLYDVLHCVLGDGGNKEATLATMYGMMIHSRNNKASALQRYFTVMLTSCQANNKVNKKISRT